MHEKKKSGDEERNTWRHVGKTPLTLPHHGEKSVSSHEE